MHGCVLPTHPASLYLASRKSKSGRAFDTISFLEVPKTSGSNERQVGNGECASALQLFCAVRAPAFTLPPSWQARDEALPSGALNDACYTHSRSCETRKVVEWRRRRRGERKFKTISVLVLHIFLLEKSSACSLVAQLYWSTLYSNGTRNNCARTSSKHYCSVSILVKNTSGIRLPLLLNSNSFSLGPVASRT